ncbi:allophanate hydrolase subunit 1 [Defluviimonas sp. WL0024]|uniref:Allophanate hydrolase subunit 1 n=1 Tax=Albidovulum salinarum TaxID=2984153 RepID=A0ABT2X6K2_9RHOB|nr:allophanate hydrolase subunit 1 [Defluviimonas sp. WL0024]MCU9849581.1 allophanate hydrolase subunit 1 [Defluviimonas sp. WL0024]
MPDAETEIRPEDAAYPRLATMGLTGLLVSFAGRLDERANRAAVAFRSAVEAEGWADVEETAASLASVFLRFDPFETDLAAIETRLRALLDSRDWYAVGLPTGRRLWRIPTVFGGEYGPQLAEAAALAGRTSEEAVAELTAAPVRVLTIGFAPGLPYMGTLPAQWDIPRQTGVTPRIPAGALVVAVRQLIVFPTATPTGWRHVGQTGFRGFRPEAAEPFPLRSGDEVRFVPIAAEELADLRAANPDNGGAVAEPIP